MTKNNCVFVSNHLNAIVRSILIYAEYLFHLFEYVNLYIYIYIYSFPIMVSIDKKLKQILGFLKGANYHSRVASTN